MPIKTNMKHRTKLSGQGLVEFALVLPVLLLIILGIIEIGHLLFYYGSLYAATREAARYGAAVNDDGGQPKYLDTTGMRDAAKRVGFIVGLADDQIDISYDCGNGTTSSLTVPTCTPGQMMRVAVQVDATYTPIVPVPNVPSIPVSSTVVRTVVNDLKVEGNFPVRPTPTNTPMPDCGDLYLYDVTPPHPSLPVGGQYDPVNDPLWHIVYIVEWDGANPPIAPMRMDSLLVDAKNPDKRKLVKVLDNPDLSINPDPDAVTTNIIWDDPKFSATIYLDGRQVFTTVRGYYLKFDASPGQQYKADVTLDTWCPPAQEPPPLTVTGAYPPP